MKFNIHVIYTGGTIGMTPSEDGLVASKNFTEVIYKKSPDFFTMDGLSFSFTEFEEPIDSSQASLRMAVKIYDIIQEDAYNADAFLVLMGSDSLSYIASTLAYLSHKDKLSVAVCGSMKPLLAAFSDAEDNLRLAVECLHSDVLHGVNVVFGNQIIPAVRTIKLYGHSAEAMTTTRYRGFLEAPKYSIDSPPSFSAEHASDFDIRVVRVSPDMHKSYVTALFSGKPDAVILECYGAGTVPGSDSAFAKGLSRLAKKNVPIFSISQSLFVYVDFSAYAASRWLIDLGVESCGDMNFEACYTKLWYLLNLGCSNKELKRLMQQNLCGEISSPPNNSNF